MYSLISGIFMLLMTCLYQPVDVVVSKNEGPIFKVISLVGITSAVIILTESYISMEANDVYGWAQSKRYKYEGNNFPLEFTPKKMSKFDFSCLHPMYSGLLQITIFTCFYKELTLGRLFYSAFICMGIFIGAHFEEQELFKLKDFNYAKYCSIIPNKFLPDINVFFKSEKEMDGLRERVNKECCQ